VWGYGRGGQEQPKKKREERELRGRATRRGESLAIQPFHTNNGSRGLLPFP